MAHASHPPSVHAQVEMGSFSSHRSCREEGNLKTLSGTIPHDCCMWAHRTSLSCNLQLGLDIYEPARVHGHRFNDASPSLPNTAGALIPGHRRATEHKYTSQRLSAHPACLQALSVLLTANIFKVRETDRQMRGGEPRKAKCKVQFLMRRSFKLCF